MRSIIQDSKEFFFLKTKRHKRTGQWATSYGPFTTFDQTAEKLFNQFLISRFFYIFSLQQVVFFFGGGVPTVLSLKSVIFILLQSTTITKLFKVTKLFAFLPKVVNNFSLYLGIEKINKSATFNKNSTSECISFVYMELIYQTRNLVKSKMVPNRTFFLISKHNTYEMDRG